MVDLLKESILYTIVLCAVPLAVQVPVFHPFTRVACRAFDADIYDKSKCFASVRSQNPDRVAVLFAA